MKTISRYIMTLALLLTAVTGAWAAETKVTIDAADYDATSTYTSYSKEKDGITITFSSARKNTSAFDLQSGSTVTITSTVGKIKSVVFYCLASGTAKYGPGCLGSPTAGQYSYIDFIGTWTGEAETFTLTSSDKVRIEKIDFTVGEADAPAGPEVAWNASTKTGTFSMPGSDVVLTPIYAKAAAFATTGTEPEVKTLLPAAAEGVIAGTDASLIAEGTGIVAFAGTSTEDTQGTLMYAVTTSAEAAPALTDFNATVPTAKNVADDGADVYVWYYIKGADTPTDQQATEENTFNDSEICPDPIKVTVLSNKFDLTFNAANANTIEAGKATVTVDDQSATVTEGKLQGVKMGSEVKMTAKEGYKFRKVEVKKKASAPSLNITSPVVGQVIGSDGKNYAYSSLPTGVTAVAKICYVSGSNGLALALTDEGTMDWSTAMTTCAAHTPAFTGGTWKLASEDEWNSMISTAGSFDDLRDGFSSVGGTNMESGYYWSSTESGANSARDYNFVSGDWGGGGKGLSDYVRACLAF